MMRTLPFRVRVRDSGPRVPVNVIEPVLSPSLTVRLPGRRQNDADVELSYRIGKPVHSKLEPAKPKEQCPRARI